MKNEFLINEREGVEGHWRFLISRSAVQVFF